MYVVGQKLATLALGVEGDWQAKSTLIPDDKPQSEQELDLSDLGQEAPVLSWLIEESVFSVVKVEANIVLIGEARECREYFFISKIGVLVHYSQQAVKERMRARDIERVGIASTTVRWGQPS